MLKKFHYRIRLRDTLVVSNETESLQTTLSAETRLAQGKQRVNLAKSLICREANFRKRWTEIRAKLHLNK